MSNSHHRYKDNFNQLKEKYSGRSDIYDKYNKHDDSRNKNYSTERG
jgi:hypothetical protein